MREIQESWMKPLALILLVSLLGLSGCKDVQEEIEAQTWLIDQEDEGIFRTLNDEEEEFIPLKHPSVLDFQCMHRDDTKRWVKYCRRRCR